MMLPYLSSMVSLIYMVIELMNMECTTTSNSGIILKVLSYCQVLQ